MTLKLKFYGIELGTVTTLIHVNASMTATKYCQAKGTSNFEKLTKFNLSLWSTQNKKRIELVILASA